MIRILKIILVIKIIISIVFIWSIVFKVRKGRKERSIEISRSDYLVDNAFGNINTIVGATRKGKTTFMSALAHSQERLILRKLDSSLTKIINYLPNVNFNKLNAVLDEMYYNGLSHEFASSSILDNFTNYIYHDFVNVLTLDQMIKEYCESYYNMYYRDCYMYTKGVSFYDRINQSRSKILYDSTLKLRQANRDGTYYIPRASILCVDEISVSDGNNKSFDKEAKEDGTKEQKIFLGQMSKETSYYNSTKQVSCDEIVTTRRLTVATWECLGCRDVIYNFLPLQKFLDYILRIRYKLFNFRFSFILSRSIRDRKRQIAYLKSSKYRKFEAKINNIKSWCNSQGLIVHSGRLYSNDVINNKLVLVDELKLCFPYNESRGTYNTHEYACVQDYLINNSQVSDGDIPFTSRLGNEESIKARISFLNKNDFGVDDF